MPEELVLLLTRELNLEAAQNVLQISCLLDLADLAKLPVRLVLHCCSSSVREAEHWPVLTVCPCDLAVSDLRPKACSRTECAEVGWLCRR